MPKIMGPKMVNRGPAGLLTATPADKTKTQQHQEFEDRVMSEAPKDRIAPSLVHLAVPIESIVTDPNNARVHNERNLRAIMLSFAQFGQRKPISVHKNGMIAMAGNGTLEALKALGWTKVAAAVDDDLSEAEAAAYGVADNRTAELARWDMETVARIDRLTAEAGLAPAGWTIDELEVLRAAEWKAPEIIDGFGVNGDGKADEAMLVAFNADQYRPVSTAVGAIRQVLGIPELEQAECLGMICKDWLEMKGVQ